MKDPKPMFRGGGTDVERRWLSEARAEEPPPEVVRRIESALGIAPGPAVAPAAPRVEVAASAGKGAIVASLAALGVGGAIGLVLLLTRAAPPAAHDAKVTPENPAAPAVAPGPGGPPRGASDDIAPAAPAAGALRDEISLIDGARAALAAGSPAEALTLLDRYRVRHPRGMLLPEALAMRIEAIDRSGDHARARALARSFLAEHPQSPLAPRLARLAVPERK
jgi:hypothetical protein